MPRFSLFVASLLCWVAALGGAAASPLTDAREAFYRRIAVQAALQFAQPTFFTYSPHSDPQERAASTVAINGHVLLEAHRATGEPALLAQARSAGDSLIAHGDMNGDGKVGWGRYWKLSGPSGDNRGGNTTFARGCVFPRNAAYDDEMYDNARIVHFFLDLYHVTADVRYLRVARQAVDDTWEQGESTHGGHGFSYFKTIGPCDRGWQIKNINMLMAVPLAMLAQITEETRYRQRAEQLIYLERQELNRNFNGRSTPNLGYYTIETMGAKAQSGGYVPAAQSLSPEEPVTCNPSTLSGESCSRHLGLEARGLYMAGRMLGYPRDEFSHEIRSIMLGFRDGALCRLERSPVGLPRSVTACVAYYCALRQIDPHFDDLCYIRVLSWPVGTQDIILGLFWGAR